MVRSRFRMISLAAVAGLGVAVAGCNPQGYALSNTSAEGWGQIAQGAGKVIGETKYDAQLAAKAEKIYEYCNVMRPVATGATIFSPANVQKAAEIARTVVVTICDQQPKSVAQALQTAVAAYAEIAVLLASKPAAPS